MDFQGGGGGAGGGFSGGSSQEQGKTRRSYDEQTLIPVTIRMALEARPEAAEGDGTQVLDDGRKLSSIKLVGAVRSVEDNSTNVVYNIEDGTGLAEVKQWLDDNDCTALQEIRQQTTREHIYVKIIGQIKDYEGKKLIVANSVRPLTSANEISHHFLEVVHSAEQHKKMDSIVTPPAGSTMNDGIGFGGQAVTQQTNQDSGNGVTGAVLNLFRGSDTSSETGMHIQDVISALGGSFSEAEIRKAVESAAEEGHIYSTISDDHFKYAN